MYFRSGRAFLLSDKAIVILKINYSLLLHLLTIIIALLVFKSGYTNENYSLMSVGGILGCCGVLSIVFDGLNLKIIETKRVVVDE